ncbi:hypothetical protein LUZ62_027339 [Rhynchospora pubera]|uniref:Uncharacterized protein n=1 Tax=Rhynchospora pubera TaxID=906938 RepID=A0AAV8HJ52_9POAL|nr:hypothetical protein LUZ62_027339 [Rhynchospora pubera]
MPSLAAASSLLRLHPPLTLALRRLSISSAASRDSRDRGTSGLEKNLLRAKTSHLLVSSPLVGPTIATHRQIALLPNQAIGFVASSQANFMRVVVENPGPDLETSYPNGNNLLDPRIGTDLLCVVRDLLKKIKRRVLVGDKVLVGSVDWTDRRGAIEDVFERATEVVDPPVANVDHLMVFFALHQPKLEPFNLTRFLIEAESTRIPFNLVLNKAELVPEQALVDWKERLQGWGYQPLFCSVNKKAGLSAVKEKLKGKTTVIMGPSGVGKSSLINALRGSESGSDEDIMNKLFEQNSKWFGEQRVGTVSKKSGKGKHTTRHVSLLPLAGGGFLADTPGFNQPSLIKVTKRNLADAFPEIRQMMKESEPVRCAFNDCLHLGEPGCVVKGDWERYPYYLQLLDEIKIREEFQLRTFGTKREGEVRYKTGSKGVKQAEPRLDKKKHRRVSRKRLNQSVLDEIEEDYFDN